MCIRDREDTNLTWPARVSEEAGLLVNHYFGLFRNIVIYPLGVFDLEPDTPMGGRLTEFCLFFWDDILIFVHGYRMEQVKSPIPEGYPIPGSLFIFLAVEP